MKTLKAKIVSAEIGADGRANIQVQISENGFKWSKSYEYFTTQVIKLSDFKKRVGDDVKGDLGIMQGQLKEIKEEIGKEFTINIEKTT
jgi:hypothetical protein